MLDVADPRRLAGTAEERWYEHMKSTAAKATVSSTAAIHMARTDPVSVDTAGPLTGNDGV